jgi:general secretion pathway protein G
MHNTPRIRRSLKKGFTLVELLIVIIIIAILAAIVVPKFADSGLRSKEAALKSNLKLLRNAVELFKADTAAYPANLNDLAATTPPASGLDQSGNPKPISAANYRGPYVQAVPNDPVSGNPFNYSTTPPTVGRVTSSASGTATDGTNYSDW